LLFLKLGEVVKCLDTELELQVSLFFVGDADAGCWQR